jgi:cytoskeletal protein CcmA (bactofilin family)
MGLFSSNAKDRRRSASPSETCDGNRGLSILAAHLRVEGELRSSGSVKIAGRVTGNVRAEHKVVIAKGGLVEGDIHTTEALVAGEVRGSVTVDGRIELHATAIIRGNVTAPRLVVREGGSVVGQVRMGNSVNVSQQDIWKRPAGSQSIAATQATEPAPFCGR